VKKNKRTVREEKDYRKEKEAKELKRKFEKLKKHFEKNTKKLKVKLRVDWDALGTVCNPNNIIIKG